MNKISRISLDQIKAVGAMVATLLTGAITIWWLWIVASKIGVKPEMNRGNVVLDQYARAKDILLVVLPLFSASLAYWVGSSGTQEAKQEAVNAKKQLDAVIDVSPEGVLGKARDKHGDAWGDAPARPA
jgi:hypothetical protein